MWTTKIVGKDVHVVPCDAQGATDHTLTLDCRCNPTREEDVNHVVVHQELN